MHVSTQEKKPRLALKYRGARSSNKFRKNVGVKYFLNDIVKGYNCFPFKSIRYQRCQCFPLHSTLESTVHCIQRKKLRVLNIVFPLKNAPAFITNSKFWMRRSIEGGIYQRAALSTKSNIKEFQYPCSRQSPRHNDIKNFFAFE